MPDVQTMVILVMANTAAGCQILGLFILPHKGGVQLMIPVMISGSLPCCPVEAW